MSSLTISSTTAIVAHSGPTPPLLSGAASTAEAPRPSRPSQPPQPPLPLQRRWWPWAADNPGRLPTVTWTKRLRLIQVQQCFIAGVALLELLSIIIIVVLNSAGQQADRLAVSAPDMYLLQWPKNVSVDARENKTETWTLYWYLNGMGIQNGSGPLLPLPRHAGANFDWRVFDNKAGRYIYATRSCNSNILLVPVANVSAPASATYSLKTTTNQTAKSICDLPQSDEITDEPAALNGQPVFGCASFALYVVDLAITGLSWPFVFWFNGAHHWQKRARISLACIKSLAAIVSVAAAALLAAGIAWVAKATGPGGASPGGISSQDAASSIPATSDSFPVISSSAVVINATTNSTSPSSSIPTSTMPTITPGSTASNLIWIAAIGQIFAAVFFIASCLLLWQQERHQGQPGASSGRQERNWSNMRQRPGSLPVYRSRRSHHNGDGGDDDEDLPPYQRDDPLGRPPSIPGYTISNGCTVTFSASVVASGPDCIPLNRVGSGSGSSNISSSSSSDANVEAAAPSISTRSSSLVLGGVSDSSSGRRSPSPDYEEVVGVEPASLLSSGGASRCTPHESD